MATGQVDDAQTSHADTISDYANVALIVWSTMHNRIRHALRHGTNLFSI
jgi:hypothetical protein